MAEQMIRCPYCVLDFNFRPMLPKLEGFFACQKCGHTVKPGDPVFRCFCQKCEALHRVA